MGGASSRESSQYLIGVVSGVAPPGDREFSEYLERCRKELCSGVELYGTVLPILQLLMPPNTQSFHVNWFVRFCLKQVEHASCNHNQGISDVCLASMHAMQFVLRYACETSRGDTFRLLWIMGEDVEGCLADGLLENYTSTDDTSPLQKWVSTALGKLCTALEMFLISVPLTTTTVEAHSEAVSLLLCMCSTALYHSTVCDEKRTNSLTEVILASNDLRALILVLLHRLMDWGEGRLPGTPMIYRCNRHSSLRTLYTIFAGGAENDSITCGDHVGRHCAQLLSILVSYGRGYRRNRALECIVAVEDCPQVRFKSLLVTFYRQMSSCPALCVLLYSLLHDSPTFIHTVMTAYPDEFLKVIQKVLHLSYTASTEAWSSGSSLSAGGVSGSPYVVSILEEAITPEVVVRVAREMKAFAYPFISFMAGTLLLLCSQDQAIIKHMSDKVSEPFFNPGRLTGNCFVSSMCIVVVVHSIVRALNDENEALAAIFIPCLANIAPFVHDIDVYTSQRLVNLLLRMLRKIQRAASQVRSRLERRLSVLREGVACDGCASDNDVIHVFTRHLLVLSEALGSLLRGGDRSNYSLIYELVYQRCNLEESVKMLSVVGLSQFEAQENVQLLLRIAEFYDNEITKSTMTDSYADALAVIRCTLKNGAGLPPFLKNLSTYTDSDATSVNVEERISLWVGEIPFLYEEFLHSYDFFGPFLWSTLLSDAVYPGGILWATNVSSLEIFPQ